MAVYLAAFSKDETIEQVKKHVAEKKITYPLLWDLKNDVQKAYEAGGTPQGWLLDREGKVVLEGAWKKKVTEAGLEKALDEQFPKKADPK